MGQINDYLQANDKNLQFILTKINQLEKIHQKVASYLSEAIAKQCRVAQVRENTLILIAANSSIAAQLRFQTADLLAKFKQDIVLKHIQEIESKVSPRFLQFMQQTTKNDFKPMQLISRETANVIKEIAESISDPKLKEVMERIARRIKD